MRNIWRRCAANKPAAIGVAVIALLVATGLAYLGDGIADTTAGAAGDGGAWLFAAVLIGGPGIYGYWCGRRPRRIRAEEQLDKVTATATEVRDMLRGARPVQRPDLIVHEGGRVDLCHDGG